MAKFNDLINGSTPVLVDFYAEWCGPCKMMPPVLHEVKDHFRDNIHILKVDIDKNTAAARNYNVQAVPTLLLFKNGKIAWRKSGVVPAHDLVGIIEKL
jgi:thioredoxin 1